VPLRLVTGPANSAKAGEVLGGFRARVDEEPFLVVPSFEDVEHNQREVAERGAVFGARVVRFAWLFETIAERSGYRAMRATDVQRELVVRRAVAPGRLGPLAASARGRGFARAAIRFVSELERSMVEPARFTRALRDWAGDGPRRAYAEDVAAIYARYRAGLEEAGLVDAELFAWRALDALRREPFRWGENPVYVYGFDDFTPLELDAIETLAVRCEADVTVSLPYERDRVAFKAIARVHAELARIASGSVHELPASDEHYASRSRAALNHLERNLFGEAPQSVDPGGAVSLFSSGGERAEVELVAAEVLALLRSGTAPGDVAVVFRRPSDYASLVEQVFDAYGIPFSIDQRVPLAHTGLGRGLLALLRCALDGSAADLLAWLRTPGLLRRPGLADELEASVRTGGALNAASAREIWEQRHPDWQLDAIDRLRDAGSPLDRLAVLDTALRRLFTVPYRRRAAILAGAELEDARAATAAHEALAGMRALVEADPRMELGWQEIHDSLADLRVRLGEEAQPERVQVASPGAIRARRFEAVFACGLQEGEFPRSGRPEPFLSDEDRRGIAAASGLVLPVREDELDRERYLFYVCASRAERLLVLSSRFSDEEGNPQAASFFVEDVKDLFSALPVRRRTLADVAWSLEEAPTEVEWERALALSGPRAEQPRPERLTEPEPLEHLAARDAFSASALEAYADCPVKWLVDRLLRPDALEPDPEQMVRGAYAHEVLELTFRRLREQTGDRRVTRENLPVAERLLLDALRERQSSFPLSPRQTRVRAAVRRLEFDLLRYLSHEAGRGGLFEPEELELEFGRDGGHEAVELGGGIRISGRVDRVDTWQGYALVRDYKSGSTVYPGARWEKDNRLQAALYMIAVRKLLELEPAGGVYVPLSGTKRAARGLVSKALEEELGSDFVSTDVVDPAVLEEHLSRVEQTICRLVEEVRAGELRPCPATCGWRGEGCTYPSICREEGS
jgi:ATP-dependent helicase/DNAse subunit B